MKLHAGVLQQIRKSAALALSQGWGSVPVSPEVVLELLDVYEPPSTDEQARTIESLRVQLRNVRAMHIQAQRDNQRKFADGVAEGRRITKTTGVADAE